MSTTAEARPGNGHKQATGPRRWALLVAGTMAMGLAALGVVLPVLPTTPFVLVGAACFSRSSPRFYNRLLANRVFGPVIEEWNEHRSIPLRAKIAAISLIVLLGGWSVGWFIGPLWAKITVASILLGVAIWILTRATTRTR